MATLSADGGSARTGAWSGDRFYFHLAVLCLAIGVFGFAPTYWLQLPSGTVDMPPIVHLHAIVFTAWLGFLVLQSWLASKGRLRQHRAWGLAGISLATLVVAAGVTAAKVMLEVHLARGEGNAALAFHISPISNMVGFAVFFAAAVANTRRPDWHKRFILVATLILVSVAINRFFFLAKNGMQAGLWAGALPYISITSSVKGVLLADSIVLLAMVRDWRVEGRVHPAWIWGFGGVLAIGLGRVPLAETSAWISVADWIARF